MTAKERIINLCGTSSPEEIAEIIGVSVYYVNRVIKAHSANLRPPLTLQNYVEAHHQGITRKNDLAAYFGVSRMTINRFENKPEIKEYFAKYMHFRKGMYLANLQEELTEILEMLEIFEPESSTTRTIKTFINQIKKYDKKTN